MTEHEDWIRGALERLAGRDPTHSSKKEDTRRRIVEAATELFLERRLKRINMEEIAERAGVSRGTLYLYAKSKEDLVVKALAEEQLRHRVPLADPDRPARERLRGMIVEAIVSFKRMPLLALLVKGDVELLRSLEDRPDVQDAFKGTSDAQLWEEAIAAARPTTRRVSTATLSQMLSVLSAVGPYVVERSEGFGLTPEIFAQSLADCLVEGICGRGGALVETLE